MKMEPAGPSLLSYQRPVRVLEEREPVERGRSVATTTVFLTASACPIGCRMCDLHRHTLPGPVPVGAIITQIETALKAHPREGWLKLYNSGNFFDARSIPPQDYPAIVRHCSGFSRLVIENHPKVGLERLRDFRDRLSIPLEVAVGLETVQPRWLGRLGKRMTRDDFDRYAGTLRDLGVDLRVFLILGVPGVSATEAARWGRLSVRHAVAASARHISLIPARTGEGWSGQGSQLPALSIEWLNDVHRDALRDVDGRAMVTVDLWDLDSDAPGFHELQRRNLTQQPD